MLLKRVIKAQMVIHPKILIIAPQPMVDIRELNIQFDHKSITKSESLTKYYQLVLQNKKAVNF